MPVLLAQFSLLVFGIQAAVLDAALWEPALTAMLDALGCEAGALLAAARGSSRIRGAAVGVDAAAVASYDGYYGRLDPVLPVLAGAPAGAVLPGQRIVRPEVMRRSEFYNDWAKPIDAGDGIVACLTRENGETNWLCFSAPLRGKRFATPRRLRLAGLLVPHLQQALRMQSALGEAAGLRAGALAAFEHARSGVAWISRQGRIVHANAAAFDILGRAEGLSVRADGRLRAALPSEESALRGLIHRAVSGGDDGVRAGGSLAIGRPGGRWPLVVHALPLGRDAAYEDAAGAAALMVVVDTGQRVEPRPELLQRLFGLTAAEAQIALAALRCDTLQGVAAELSVSLSTVRTHLQRVYDKTGVHRQAGLAQLVQALDGGLAGSGTERMN